jgi:hypothetical protein
LAESYEFTGHLGGSWRSVMRRVGLSLSKLGD